MSTIWQRILPKWEKLKMAKIVVSGIGVISSLGQTLEENRISLKNGVTGIVFPNSKRTKSTQFPFGEIKKTTTELRLNIDSKADEFLSRVEVLSKIAFQDAIEDANLTREDLESRRTAFISASTVGGMSNTESLYKDATENEKASQYIETYSPSTHLQRIVKHYKMKGPTSVINTACSSSANAIMLGAKLLQQNKVDIAIVGGVDCLSDFTIRGFNALGILTKTICKPFDENREGLNLGEAAGYLVLKRENLNSTRKKYGFILGWANTNDSFHSSALNEDGSGIMNCINQALANAEIKTSDIDFINAHGTGTGNNDLAELTALSKMFSKETLLSSTKSYSGHTLAAAGALECIFTLLALNNQEFYPSLNIENHLSINGYSASTVYKKFKSKYALSNSFGFNGNCTSLVISKYEN